MFEADRAEKVLVATDTPYTKIGVQGADHYVRLSKVKTLTNKAPKKSKTKKFPVVKMAERLVINAMDMCAVDVQDELARFTISLTMCSVAGNIPGGKVVSYRLQRVTM